MMWSPSTGTCPDSLEKRTKAVTNKRMVFMDGAGQKVDAPDDLIGSSKFERLMEVIMERKYYGTSAVEFIMGKDFDYKEIDRRHIRPESREIAISQFDARGVSVDDLPMVWLMGDPYELGKLLQCSLYALYKRSGFGDFAQYVEIFGQPVRVVKYDAYDEETQKKVRNIFGRGRLGLTMMIPKQAEFDMLDGKTSNGTGELQERLINCCNQEMSVAIWATRRPLLQASRPAMRRRRYMPTNNWKSPSPICTMCATCSTATFSSPSGGVRLPCGGRQVRV